MSRTGRWPAADRSVRPTSPAPLPRPVPGILERGRTSLGLQKETAVVTVKTIAILFPLTALLAGCNTSTKPSTPALTRPAMGAAAAAPATRPADAEPVAAQFAAPRAATPAHLHEIEPAVLDLAARADQGDRAYFTAHMGQAGDHL